MNDPSPNRGVDSLQAILRPLVGAVLALASIPFFWKGTPAIGEVGLDLTYVTARFSTASAGVALLISGVLLLLPRRPPSDSMADSGASSTAHLLVAIGFYTFVALLPSIALAGVGFYLHRFQAGVVNSLMPPAVFGALYVQVPLLIWLVFKVTPILKAATSARRPTQAASNTAPPRTSQQTKA